MNDRAIPGVFLDSKTAEKLYFAGMGIVEFTELIGDLGGLPINLLQVFSDQFFQVISGDNGFKFYEADDREDALEHLRQQRARLDQEIAAFEGNEGKR
jgi:hypothetical protein